ncbi:MAG: SGNH/GDSL hydrolase family protein [Kiritimatiellae bacterium]|nr:SGNH/GDSL hydrolase family protein [Kiritimatiellia bacterium]
MIKRNLVVLLLCAAVTASLTYAAPFGDNVIPRGSLDNTRVKFQQGGKATVAFLGGSITEMEGFRPMVCESLKKRFQKTEFTFIAAGISSTCSTTGAFRLGRDVLSQGQVDLLFVEFAVNDDQDAGHAEQEAIRGMEGVVRQARLANPEMDIVMTFFVNEFIMGELQQGVVPLTLRAHTKVAERYEIPTVNLAAEVALQIKSGALTWQKFGGVHPAPFGNAIAAAMIDELFDRAWCTPLNSAAKAVAHSLPAPLDELSYFNAHFVDIHKAKLLCGCTIKVPDWQALKGDKRARFTTCDTLCAEGIGAEFSLDFEGRAVGAFITAGADAGVCAYSIDGSELKQIDLFKAHSQGLHYPYTVMFADGLKPGKHKLTVRMVESKSPERNALRVMHFCVN